MTYYSSYSFKVWLAAVLISPLFLVAYCGFTTDDFLSGACSLGGYLLFVIVGGLLSSPSFLFLILFSTLIGNSRQGFISRHKKLVLSAVGLALTVTPFGFVGLLQMAFSPDLLFWIPYAIVVVAAIWYFKFGDEIQTTTRLLRNK